MQMDISDFGLSQKAEPTELVLVYRLESDIKTFFGTGAQRPAISNPQTENRNGSREGNRSSKACDALQPQRINPLADTVRMSARCPQADTVRTQCGWPFDVRTGYIHLCN